MQKITLFLTITLVLQAFTYVQAQDIHFSQFYVAPMYINPAKTGFFDGTYRFSGIYRNQWNSVTVPYQTILGSLDLSIPGGMDKKDIFGIGLMAISDKVGDAHLTTTQVEGALSFNKCLDRNGQFYIGAGIQGGYTTSNFDYHLLSFDENFEGGSTTENLVGTSAAYADVSSGVEFNYLESKQTNFNVGVAVMHINEPVLTFMDNSRSYIYRKLSLDAGATFSLSSLVSFLPKLNYSLQGEDKELIFGGLGKLITEKKGSSESAFYLGAMCRWQDAFIFITRFDINNFGFTFSYDVNYSRLVLASQGMGGPEISVQYTGSIASTKRKNFSVRFSDDGKVYPKIKFRRKKRKK